MNVAPRPTAAQLRAPGLSVTLTGPIAPDRCRACGTAGKPDGPKQLTIWREHDEYDQPTVALVVLCRRCTDELVHDHPRLYGPLDVNEPVPGVLALCQGCTHREGLTCRHPDLKTNGGPGMIITIKKRVRMHIQRSPRSTSGFVWLWPEPARACAGRTLGPCAPQG